MSEGKEEKQMLAAPQLQALPNEPRRVRDEAALVCGDTLRSTRTSGHKSTNHTGG